MSFGNNFPKSFSRSLKRIFPRPVVNHTVPSPIFREGNPSLLSVVKSTVFRDTDDKRRRLAKIGVPAVMVAFRSVDNPHPCLAEFIFHATFFLPFFRNRKVSATVRLWHFRFAARRKGYLVTLFFKVFYQVRRQETGFKKPWQTFHRQQSFRKVYRRLCQLNAFLYTPGFNGTQDGLQKRIEPFSSFSLPIAAAAISNQFVCFWRVETKHTILHMGSKSAANRTVVAQRLFKLNADDRPVRTIIRPNPTPA